MSRKRQQSTGSDLLILYGNVLPMTTTTVRITDQTEFQVGYVRQSGRFRKKSTSSLSFKVRELVDRIYLFITCY